MAEYIDRNEIPAPYYAEEYDEYVVGIGEINSIPTADVQEVKHGEWVYHYRLKKFVCLECGYETKHKPDFNYCPNCGAKMDKERETE